MIRYLAATLAGACGAALGAIPAAALMFGLAFASGGGVAWATVLQTISVALAFFAIGFIPVFVRSSSGALRATMVGALCSYVATIVLSVVRVFSIMGAPPPVRVSVPCQSA